MDRVAWQYGWSFNPRVRGGRDDIGCHTCPPPIVFQSARPRGTRLLDPPRSGIGYVLFQSARPRGTRSAAECALELMERVSIRASAGDAIQAVRLVHEHGNVSIRASAGDAIGLARGVLPSFTVSIRASAGDAIASAEVSLWAKVAFTKSRMSGGQRIFVQMLGCIVVESSAGIKVWGNREPPRGFGARLGFAGGELVVESFTQSRGRRHPNLVWHRDVRRASANFGRGSRIEGCPRQHSLL